MGHAALTAHTVNTGWSWISRWTGHLLQWFMLVVYAAFSQGLGVLVAGNCNHAHSPATTAALQMQLPGHADVRNPRANNTICCAFHSAKLFCICQIAAVCCSDHRPAEQEEIF